MPRVTDDEIRRALSRNSRAGEVAIELGIKLRRVIHVQGLSGPPQFRPPTPERQRDYFMPEHIARHRKLASPQGRYWAEMEGLLPMPRLLQGEVKMPRPRKRGSSEFRAEDFDIGGDAA